MRLTPQMTSDTIIPKRRRVVQHGDVDMKESEHHGHDVQESDCARGAYDYRTELLGLLGSNASSRAASNTASTPKVSPTA